MKKILIASFAVAVAAFVQAAQVEWTSGDLSQYVTSEIKADGVNAYYYVIDEAKYNQLAGMSQAQIYDEYKDSLDSATATVAMDEFGMANAELTHTTEPAYVVAIYKFDTNSGGAYALASALSFSSATDPDTGLVTDFSNQSVAETAWEAGKAGGTGPGWTAVPEPTTVALLALGLAAVGLKRKVA